MYLKKCSLNDKGIFLYKSIGTSPGDGSVYCRLYQLLKDFCGVVNEASLKANIILVHEVLEEALVSEKLLKYKFIKGLFLRVIAWKGS